MKIAIPSSDDSGLDSEIFPHFGRCPFYTLIDSESNQISILSNTSVHFGGSKGPPELLIDAGVEILICADLGTKAVGLFKEAGIDVYIGANGTIEKAIGEWKEEALKTAEKEYNCKGHEAQGK